MEKERQYEFTCSAAQADGAYTVLLTGYIKRDNTNAAHAVAALLDKKPANAALKVRLVDFYGGDVPEGLKIHADLKARKVDMEADGVVASMGTVILTAGDTVTGTKRLRAMMHRPIAELKGNADDLVEVATELKGYEDGLVNILAERTGLSATDARAKFMPGEDAWFTAKQLKDMHLVHDIVDTHVRTVAMGELAKLKTPAQLLARFAACYDGSTPEPGKTKAMNKEITAALGLEEGANEVAVKASIDAVLSENKELKAAAKQRDEDEVTRQLEEANSSIEAALKADRITKAQADTLKEDAKSAPGVVAKTVATLTAGMPAHRSLTGALGDRAASGKGKSIEAAYEKREEDNWDFKKWSQDDPKGLAELRDNHKELYAELRKTL